MSGAIHPLPQYAFVAWRLVKHRDNFTFTFIPNRAVAPNPELVAVQCYFTHSSYITVNTVDSTVTKVSIHLVM
jgi:hypothetical protein